jgi:hypothetical protein
MNKSKKISTCYELVEQNLNLIVTLINNSLMNINVLKYIEIYERYLSLNGNKGQRYEQLSEEYNMSVSSVKRYIQKMNKAIK